MDETNGHPRGVGRRDQDLNQWWPGIGARCRGDGVQNGELTWSANKKPTSPAANFQSPHRSYADSTKLVPQHAPASSPSQLWSIAVFQLFRYRAQGGARSSKDLLPSQRSQYTIEERTPTALPYTGTMAPGDLSSERKSAWAAVLLYTDRRTRHQPVASQNELRNCLSWGVQLPVPLNALGILLTTSIFCSHRSGHRSCLNGLT